MWKAIVVIILALAGGYWFLKYKSNASSSNASTDIKQDRIDDINKESKETNKEVEDLEKESEEIEKEINKDLEEMENKKKDSSSNIKDTQDKINNNWEDI